MKHEKLPPFWLAAILTVVVTIVFIYFLAYFAQLYENGKPCSAFETRYIGEIPVRCAEYYGITKSQSTGGDD